MARTIVALYDRADDARRAVEDLTRAGVPRDDISVVAAHPGERREAASVDVDADRDIGTGTVIGATLGGIGGAMVAMAALGIPGVGAVIASGPIVAGLLGAGAGAVAGGLVGSMTGLGVPEEEVHAYAEGVERGGTLLLVHADHAAPERISEVLARHPPADVRSRGAGDGGKDALAGRGADWRTAAWAPFDQSAGPVTLEGRPQDAGERSKEDPAADRAGVRTKDDTDVGQPGTSPGTRGGATAFGGIERETPRTKQPTPASGAGGASADDVKRIKDPPKAG
jgi:uncharacterized membrane protein